MASAAILMGGHGRRFGGRDKSAIVVAGRSIRDRQLETLGGLDAALASARDEELLLLACDMPFVTAPFLEYLVALSAERDIVVPQTARGYHPLCAVYTRRCHPAVVRRLAERRLTLMGLLDEMRVRVVEKDEIERFGDAERLLANVNMPGELRDLEALLNHEL